MNSALIRFICFSFILQFSIPNSLSASESSLTCNVLSHDSGNGGSASVQWRVNSGLPGRTVEVSLYHGDRMNSSNLIRQSTHNNATAIGQFLNNLSAGEYLFTASGSGFNHACIFVIQRTGCTDPEANNYDPQATIDDGSCTYFNSQCPEITSVVTSEPSCGESNGSILAYASGSNKQYKLNQGSWRSSGFFGNLGQGTYTVSVRNSSTGCSDYRSVSLTCGEDNSCPSLQSIQIGQYPSTCSSTDAWITVHASGGNNEYSNDGGATWQGWATFSGLTAGFYDLRVRNVDLGCEFSTSITIPCSPSCSDGRRNGGETGVDCGGPCVPCCPEITNIRVDKYPYCSSPTGGSIAIAARGKDLKYSITGGGPYQSSPVFTNVLAGIYNISVKSTSTRCVENSTFELICVDECPIITTVATSEANCEVANSGLITIGLSAGQGNAGGSKPGGINGGSGGSVYQYSIDNGNTWSSRGTFSVSAGEYSVLVRNNETGCLRGQSGILVGCHSCWDGIKNGNETEVDCGGDCHTCDCPSVEDIKASIKAVYGGKSEGGPSRLGSSEPSRFICDLPENYDCPDCISVRFCSDNLDNDGDDLCDCEDPDCSLWYDEICEKPKEACNDGIDNDGDNDIDCLDSDCLNSRFCDLVGQGSGKNTPSIINENFVHDILILDNLEEFTRDFGITHWSKSFVTEHLTITPLAKINDYEISGIAVFFGDMSTTDQYVLINKNEVINIITPSLKEDVISEASWTNSVISLEAAALLLYKAEMKYSGRIDLDLLQYINKQDERSNNNRSNAPECEVMICDFVCTIWSESPFEVVKDRTGHQSQHYRIVFKETGVRATDRIFETYDLAADFIDGLGGPRCLQFEYKCETVSCDAGDTPRPTYSGGSSSSRNTGSIEFNDRIKNCTEPGGSPGDPPRDESGANYDDAFCDAITRIFSTCVGSAGTGLAEPGKRHWLEILASVTDCDNSGPLDDEGNLSEVADFICDGGANDVNIQIVNDYVSYISLVGAENATCFQDYITTAAYLNTYNLQPVLASRLLFTLRITRNIQFTLVNFNSTFGAFLDIHKDLEPILTLLKDNQLGQQDYEDLIELMLPIHEQISDPIPRLEYIDQIRAIKIYLEKRSADFGDAVGFLETLLPLLIQQEDFTNEEVVAIYNLAYEWYKQAAYYGLKAVTAEVIKAVKPFIEIALLEAGVPAAIKILSSLPEAAKTAEILSIINKLKTTSSLSKFKYAHRFGIDSYGNLIKLWKNLGLGKRSELGVSIHHLIEQRFANIPGISQWLGTSTNAWKSIVLTNAEHQAFTNAWLARIGRAGSNSTITTTTATLRDIQQAAREIYAAYPEILLALGL